MQMVTEATRVFHTSPKNMTGSKQRWSAYKNMKLKPKLPETENLIYHHNIILMRYSKSQNSSGSRYNSRPGIDLYWYERDDDDDDYYDSGYDDWDSGDTDWDSDW